MSLLDRIDTMDRDLFFLGIGLMLTGIGVLNHEMKRRGWL